MSRAVFSIDQSPYPSLLRKSLLEMGMSLGGWAARLAAVGAEEGCGAGGEGGCGDVDACGGAGAGAGVELGTMLDANIRGTSPFSCSSSSFFS